MNLTKRELQILELISKGNSSKMIASALGTSEQTVKNQVTSILRKLGVKNRTQAVTEAMRTGIIKPKDEFDLAEISAIINRRRAEGQT